MSEKNTRVDKVFVAKSLNEARTAKMTFLDWVTACQAAHPIGAHSIDGDGNRVVPNPVSKRQIADWYHNQHNLAVLKFSQYELSDDDAAELEIDPPEDGTCNGVDIQAAMKLADTAFAAKMARLSGDRFITEKAESYESDKAKASGKFRRLAEDTFAVGEDDETNKIQRSAERTLELL